MTWTKLGDEFPAAARDLTSDEFRTHIEALCWSSLRLLDLRIPKRDVRRFAESDDPDQAVKGLADKGWWEDCDDHWHIGVRFPEWQQDRAQVEHRREYVAEAQRRGRAHKRGDHSLCVPGKCPHAVSTVDTTVDSTRDSTRDSTCDPGRDGSGPTVPPVPKSKDLGQGQIRVGNFVDDKEQPIANSQDRRVPDGPETVADDAPRNRDETTRQTPATDRNARASEPETPSPRRCEFEGCQLPDKPLRSGERVHVGCGALIRRAEREQPEVITR